MQARTARHRTKSRILSEIDPVESLATTREHPPIEPASQFGSLPVSVRLACDLADRVPSDGGRVASAWFYDWKAMTNEPTLTAQHPLAADALSPLSVDRHRTWRLRPGDFGFAIDAPSIPILAEEFAPIARSYPIVFAAKDLSPMAILGLGGTNLFVTAWGGSTTVAADDPVAKPASDVALASHYIPAFVRRYPFGFLQAPDGRLVLGIHEDCARVRKNGDDGEALFVDGKPAELVQRALAFCEAFHTSAATTMAFVAALEERGLLVDRQADIVLADGRKLGLTGFRIVDQDRFQALDGPTVVEWHGKGWLALVHHHLASLDQWRALLRWQSNHDATSPITAAKAEDPVTPELVPTEG